jgi:3-oxoacyl-[acyl-carrier-protein] synthase-3
MVWEMDGRTVFHFGENIVGEIIRELAITYDEIDSVVPHQPNLLMLQAIQKKWNIPAGKLFTEGVVEYGNTSSSAIFIGLEKVIKDFNNKRIAIISFGAELSYGGFVIQRK